jgi:hypothetical protein
LGRGHGPLRFTPHVFARVIYGERSTSRTEERRA